MMEWLRFILTAVLLIIALGSFALAVHGVYEFGFVMNRMHAAGIGDTLALGCVLFALIIASGANMDSLKLFLIVVFMWFTSPVSTHFLGQVEYYTNPNLYRFMDRRQGLSDTETAGSAQQATDCPGTDEPAGQTAAGPETADSRKGVEQK